MCYSTNFQFQDETKLETKQMNQNKRIQNEEVKRKFDLKKSANPFKNGQTNRDLFLKGQTGIIRFHFILSFFHFRFLLASI